MQQSDGGGGGGGGGGAGGGGGGGGAGVGVLTVAEGPHIVLKVYLKLEASGDPLTPGQHPASRHAVFVAH